MSNNNKSTLVVVFAVILLVILGVFAWKYHVLAPDGVSTQMAALSGSILNQSSTTTVQATATSSTSTIASPSATTTDNSAPSITTTPVTSVAVSAPTGWTTFNEGEYEVAGAYPGSWYEYDAIPLGGSLQFSSVPQSSATAGGAIVVGAAEITVYRTPESVTQAVAEDSLSGVVQSQTSGTVSGENVTIIAYTVNGSENSITAYVPHDGEVYRIVLEYHGESQFSAVYANFLSSFQFTN